MENIITNKLKANKTPLNIIGYIKNCVYINTIKDTYNITLITPQRNNAVTKITIMEDHQQLLKERSKVEHFFSYLKKGYKRISCINDTKLETYYNFLYIAVSLISLKIIIKL